MQASFIMLNPSDDKAHKARNYVSPIPCTIEITGDRIIFTGMLLTCLNFSRWLGSNNIVAIAEGVKDLSSNMKKKGGGGNE